ncbi:MAG: putative nucleotide-diphospho-sugar transferase [Phycisphaerales bacterium]
MDKVRMYTSFTDSHRELYERFFYPSVADSFELTAEEFDQECSTGEYHSDGWVRAVSRKIEVIRNAIDLAQQERDDYLVFSDCDIQFFGDCEPDITRRMKDLDFIAQDDGVYCTGFMAIRADDRSAFMWQWAAENIERYNCDQPTGNAFIRKHERWLGLGRMIPAMLRFSDLGRHAASRPMRFGKFPRIEYFNHMHLGTDSAVWDGQSEIVISPERLDRIRMVHANYTMGIENKIRLLEIIGEQKAKHDEPNSIVHEPAVCRASA